MWYTNLYSNIKVYQKYLVTSIYVGCAMRSLYTSSGPKAEGFPTNNQRGRNYLSQKSDYPATFSMCPLILHCSMLFSIKEDLSDILV